MDAPDADPVLLQRSLGFLRRINRWFGYRRSMLRHVRPLLDRVPTGQVVRVLDVGTGGADLPEAIVAMGAALGRSTCCVALDLHERTIELASQHVVDPRIRFVRGDAVRLPFADGAFHVVTAGLFLHHLDDGQIVEVLREMSRVASVGIVVGDLLRRRRAYCWIRLFTLLANPMVRHDAAVSVAQSFRRGELQDFCQRAGLSFLRFHEHFGHRFVLAGAKSR